VAPKRRTMTEKKMAVLQSNRHPTAGARFHQSVLESSVQTWQLIDSTFGYETNKLKLEKRFYKYQKRLQRIEKLKALGRDTFLLEKDLEIEKLKLTREIMSLKSQEGALQNTREELMEWSDIKQELYDEATRNGEIWSPDSVDGDVGFQRIPLALRHFQNYLVLKQNPSDGDISSVLNIEGLCLTALQDGMKENSLGLYMKQLTNEQIAIIFNGIYGWNASVERIENFLIISHENQQLIYPTDYNLWKHLQEQNKDKK
jgi:hypothetical protein